MTAMKTFVIFSVVYVALCISTSADRVFTHDGRTFEGEVSFEPNGDVVVAGQTLKNYEVLRITLDALESKTGLSDVSFKLYQGNWDQLPDFSKLTIDKSGRMSTNRIDLSPLGMDSARRVINLKQGDTLDRWSAPPVEGRPFSISAIVEASGDGVLIAQGGNKGGFALYLQNGHLQFVTRINRELALARDEEPFPLNQPVNIVAELRRDLNLVLTVDGREAAKIESTGMLPRRPDEGLSVGFDQRPYPVGHYGSHNTHFQGTLKELQLRVMGVGLVYTGKLNITETGDYTFNLSANTTTRLEIDGNLIKPNEKLKLTRGVHKLSLIYAQLIMANNAEAEEHLTLEWSGPGVPKQALTVATHPQISSWQPADTAIPSEGIMTTDGSFLAQPVKAIDRTHIQYGDTRLDRKVVGTIFLRPLSIFETRMLTDKPAGVLLMDGTFTKGKLLRLDENTITVSSILFGLQKFSRGRDAVAVVINPAPNPMPKYSFRLHDGSILFAPKYSVQNNHLHLMDTPFQEHSIPIAAVVEILHGVLPNHVQRAEAYWTLHSERGRQFLGKRARKSMTIIKQFREAQFKLAAAQKISTKAMRVLPAAEKAEAEAIAIRDLARPKLDAPKALVRDKTQTHAKTNKGLADATRKMDEDCSKTNQAYLNLENAVQSRQMPALRRVAEAQLELLRLKGNERKRTESERSAAVKGLAVANREVAKLKTALGLAMNTGTQSDQAEAAAQDHEAQAWSELFLAKQALEEAQKIFNAVEQKYQEKKFVADTLRGEINRAKRDWDRAKGQIGILEPALQSTFHR